MASSRLDLVGIGNAIVDVVAPAHDAEIARLGLLKGAMTLVDADRAVSLYREMAPGVESSGGSVGNSCAVAAIMGARVAFMGKVANDQLGAVFRHDIEAAGVYFPTKSLATAEVPTARCLIMVTPDAQRTMSTYLGACVAFSAGDVDDTLIADAAVTYLEGYLFDPAPAQEAFRHAANVARNAGRLVALSLSDAFCVGRHRAAFRQLVAQQTNILFANEAEICSLYETSDVFEAAQMACAEVDIAVITRGPAGSLVLSGDAVAEIGAEPASLIDTTGAGDAYAAGFLAAITRGWDIAEAGRLGARAAARVIEQFGARPIGALDGLKGAVLPLAA